MAQYSFETTWRIEAPIDTVYDTIHDARSWPEWWDAVRSVDDVSVGGPDGVGDVRRYTFKGRLPYLLRFDLTTDVVEPPHRLGGTAVGELEGRGEWTLREDDGGTVVRYDWKIRTTPAWMNALAPLPFVRRIFVINHDYVMARGLVGIRRRLGVAGRAVEHEGGRSTGDGEAAEPVSGF